MHEQRALREAHRINAARIDGKASLKRVNQRHREAYIVDAEAVGGGAVAAFGPVVADIVRVYGDETVFVGGLVEASAALEV